MSSHMRTVHSSQDPSHVQDTRADFRDAHQEILNRCFDVPVKAVKLKEAIKLREVHCLLCAKSVSVFSGGFSSHVWKEHLGDPKPLLCSLCPHSEGGNNLKAMVSHLKSEHQEEDFTKIVDNRGRYLEDLHAKLLQCTKGETKGEKIECLQCNRPIVNSRESRKKHIWCAHLNGPFSILCSLCPYKNLYSRHDAIQHVKQVHDKQDFDDAIVDVREEYMEQFEKETSKCFPMPFPRKSNVPVSGLKDAKFCHLCKKDFSKIEDFVATDHVWVEHMNNPVGLQCLLCQFSSGRRFQLIKDHLWEAHGKSEDIEEHFSDKRNEFHDEISEKFQLCFRTFYRGSTAGGQIRCQLCNKNVAFATTLTLRNHIWKRHMSDDEAALSCKACSFTSKYSVTQMKIHVTEEHPESKEISSYDDNLEKFESEITEKMVEAFGEDPQMSRKRISANRRANTFSNVLASTRKFCKLCDNTVDIDSTGVLGHTKAHHLTDACENPDGNSEMATGAQNSLLLSRAEECFGRRAVVGRESRALNRPDTVLELKKCNLCAQHIPASSLNSLQTHAWTEHMGDPQALCCEYCDFKTSLSTKEMRIHLREKHPDNEEKFHDKRDQFRPELRKNIRKCFQEIKRDRKVIEQKMCMMCEKEVDIYTQGYLEHVWTVHMNDPRAISCPHCAFTVGRTLVAMKDHVLHNHKDEEPKEIIDNRSQYSENLSNLAKKCFGNSARTRIIWNTQKEHCYGCQDEVPITDTASKKRHIWREHMGNPNALFCHHCNFSCDFYAQNMKAHIKNIHPSENPETSYKDERDSYQEELATQMIKCFRQQTIRRSLNEEFDTKPCRLCGELVRESKDCYKRHVWRAHLGDPKSAECKICGMSYGFDFGSAVAHLKTRHPEAKEDQIKDNRPMYQKPTLKMLGLCFPDFGGTPKNAKRKISAMAGPSPLTPTSTKKSNIANRTETVAESKSESRNEEISTDEKLLGSQSPMRSDRKRTGISSTALPFLEGPKNKMQRLTTPHTHDHMKSVTAEHNEIKLPNTVTSQKSLRTEENFKTEWSAAKGTVACKGCQVETDDEPDSKRKHVWMSHMNNPKAFTCKLCDFSATLKRASIREHAEEVHSFVNEEEIKNSYIDKFSELKLVYSRLKNICFP